MSAQLWWKFCEELRRCAETAVFPCKTTNKYCRDLQRRRICAKTAQQISKSWLVKFPLPCCLRLGRLGQVHACLRTHDAGRRRLDSLEIESMSTYIMSSQACIVWEGCLMCFAWVSCVLARFARCLPEFHHNFTRCSPEYNHRNFTGCLPEHRTGAP